MAVPRTSPDIGSQDVGEELQISDDEVAKMFRGSAGDVLMVGEIINPNTWELIVPAIAARILGDVDGGVMLEEGDAVPEMQCLQPPSNIVLEGGIKDDGNIEACSAAFRGQNPICEKSPRGHHCSSIDEFTCEGAQILLRGFRP